MAPHRLVVGALIVVLSITWAVADLSAWPIRVNTSPSIPLGFYLFEVRVAAPARGQLVLVCMPREVAREARRGGYLSPGSCRGGVQPVGKTVLAVAGDDVEVGLSGLRVNGEEVPDSARVVHDRAGRVVARVPEGTLELRPGEVWLHGGNDDRSWDSRYFGPVSERDIQGRLEPLLTWRGAAGPHGDES